MVSTEIKLSLSTPKLAKKERKAIDLNTKMMVITQHEGGKKVSVIARELKLSPSTVSTILKDKERIREAVKGSASLQSTIITKQRTGPVHEMEKLLYIWVEDQIQKRTPLNRFTVQAKARSLFQTLKERAGEEDNNRVFVASIGWFKRFKKRFQSSIFRVTEEEESSADEGARREESRNENLFHQKNPQSQSQTAQKINIPAALGKPANSERSRKSFLNSSSNNNSILASKSEAEDSPPPAKKFKEIHIDIDVSEDESPVVTKPLLQPVIDPPVQKSVTTSIKPTPAQLSPVIHNSVLDLNLPLKQKRILIVPNHQQSVMSNLSSLWKAGRLCDALLSNGTVNLKVHKMILGAVCPKVLDVFYNTPQHKLPKVTFPNLVSKEGLLAFAEYMYNGVLDLDLDLLFQMKIIAQRLDMKDFEQLCSNQLKSSLVPANTLPTIVEPMMSEPCSSSGLIQQMLPPSTETSIIERIPISKRSHQTSIHTVDSLNTTTNNNNTISNLPLVEVRAEFDDSLMEVVNNNFTDPSSVTNICDANVSNRPPPPPQVKIEKIEPDDEHYSRETVSSNINYSTLTDSIITSNFTHLSKTDLSQSSSSSASQHTNNTLQNHLTVNHIWTQNNKDKGNLVENTDLYPIGLFTANWASVPLHTQENK